MVAKDDTYALTLPSDTEIVMTRVFDAPRELVWQAMTDPDAIPKWWGPRRYTTRVDKMDVRVGGVWRYVQHDAEGNEHAFHGEYRELVEPEKIAYSFIYEPMPDKSVIDSAVLEDIGGKTRVTVTSSFDSKEDRDGMLESGMEGGATETWDRLAELLEEMKTA